ncbi:hypothetical protein GTY65_39870 [Streptomyces sp. SID8379]|uniref:hypothetical protein n=1 Tax=unclassified Streptomyces TaxID=2593676 RepID=UPI000362909E|nr:MULTISPECIES: hypothetical protein [unclassified Streptomyces]MYW70169.1 hypothetical protein [Streptomyces sp. SID8379]
MLFADAEGSAGIVGAYLRDALPLLAVLPCAEQALNPERQGRAVDEAMLLELREQEDEELGEAADMDDLPARRAEFLERLGLSLPPLTELLVQARKAAALDPSYVLLNMQGDAYQQA